MSQKSSQEAMKNIMEDISATSNLRNHGITVEKNGNCLILRGRVSSFYQKQLASHIAMKTGIEIRNLIEVS